MFNNINYFAEAAHASGGKNLFSALGIDWQMLVFQIAAFIVLVILLGKFVFPVMLKAVDERKEKIDESVKAAHEAEKKAETAEAKIEDALKDARKEAADIVATAKAEATQMRDDADKNAKARADRIVAEAHEGIEKQVIAARKTLEKDTLTFVKKAAGLAIENVADDKIDTAVVKKAVEGARR